MSKDLIQGQDVYPCDIPVAWLPFWALLDSWGGRSTVSMVCELLLHQEMGVVMVRLPNRTTNPYKSQNITLLPDVLSSCRAQG